MMVTENCKRGLVTCAEEDRITNLPEHLVNAVLERVRLEEAVRTSILSKKWRYQWTRMMSLVLDEHFFCPDAMLLPLFNSPCLTMVWISFEKPIQDFVPLEKLNFATLSNLPQIKTFFTNSYFIKFLAAEKIPKLLPREISSLRELCIVEYQLSDLDQLHGALCLLRNSPNLESLHLSMKVEPQVDEGPDSNLLESPNCLDCTLNRLQTVEITDLEGSKPELLFIKLLLAHSPFLEEFTITPSDTSEDRKIAKYLMQFPRASPKAKIFYLDP